MTVFGVGRSRLKSRTAHCFQVLNDDLAVDATSVAPSP